MLNILKDFSHFLLKHEMAEAEKCDVPEENIKEWLQIIEQRKQQMAAKHGEQSKQYQMLLEIEKDLKQVEAIRQQRCSTQS